MISLAELRDPLGDACTFAIIIYTMLGFCRFSLAELWASSGCLDFACSAWQSFGVFQDTWILHVQLGRALGFFRMLGFCMFSLAQPWLPSECLEFACKAWQSLGYLQDAEIFHVQLGRALS